LLLFQLTKVTIFSLTLHKVNGTVVGVLQIGPGIVNLEWESALFGHGAFLQVLTPVEPLSLRMVHHVYCERWLPTVVAKFFLYSEALMVSR